MLSEIVSMVTDYYFDRDNIFPSSSRVVLHSHWDPRTFPKEQAVYIMRDPLEVAMSVYDYARGNGWEIADKDLLRTRKIASLSWHDHLAAAQALGHHIVDYGRLVGLDGPTLDRLGAHLGVPADWIAQAMKLLSAKHFQSPHASDTPFKTLKDARSSYDTVALQVTLSSLLADEKRFYEQALQTL